MIQNPEESKDFSGFFFYFFLFCGRGNEKLYGGPSPLFRAAETTPLQTKFISITRDEIEDRNILRFHHGATNNDARNCTDIV